MNRFTEREMRGEAVNEIEIEIPAGVAPTEYIEETFGAQLGSHDDIPSDVDFSCVVKFVKKSKNDYTRTNDDTNFIDDSEDFVKFMTEIDGHTYSSKRYESVCEKDFYKRILRVLSRDYHLIAQVCLASIIDKVKSDGSDADHRGELFRIIDFGIFDDNYDIKLLIEINDKTHDLPKTQLRDRKVQTILDKAGIKLIKFNPKDRYKQDYLIEQLGEFVKPELRKK